MMTVLMWPVRPNLRFCIAMTSLAIRFVNQTARLLSYTSFGSKKRQRLVRARDFAIPVRKHTIGVMIPSLSLALVLSYRQPSPLL